MKYLQLFFASVHFYYIQLNHTVHIPVKEILILHAYERYNTKVANNSLYAKFVLLKTQIRYKERTPFTYNALVALIQRGIHKLREQNFAPCEPFYCIRVIE